MRWIQRIEERFISALTGGSGKLYPADSRNQVKYPLKPPKKNAVQDSESLGRRVLILGMNLSKRSSCARKDSGRVAAILGLKLIWQALGKSFL
jgi:hypothetical protein